LTSLWCREVRYGSMLSIKALRAASNSDSVCSPSEREG
jgi:hypothetical protein